MATNEEPKVGRRLRAIREQQGLSMRALGERSGLSVNAISQIERGENSPTVSSLHRLATALDIPITELFQEETRQTSVLVKRNQGLRSQSIGTEMESLGIGLFNQQLEPFRMRIEPGGANVDDPVSHPGEEFVHCLDGETEYLVGDRVFQLKQGDSLLFDAQQPHAYRNLSGKAATLLIVFQSSRNQRLIQRRHLDE